MQTWVQGKQDFALSEGTMSPKEVKTEMRNLGKINLIWEKGGRLQSLEQVLFQWFQGVTVFCSHEVLFLE